MTQNSRRQFVPGDFGSLRRSFDPLRDDDPLTELARLVSDTRSDHPSSDNRRAEPYPETDASYGQDRFEPRIEPAVGLPDESPRRPAPGEPAPYVHPESHLHALAPDLQGHGEEPAEGFHLPAEQEYPPEAYAAAYADDEVAGFEPPPARRRFGLVLGAVLGAILIAAAGVIGYRSQALRGVAGDGSPPVIKAPAEPAKVAATDADGKNASQQGKLIYDRMDGAGPRTDVHVVGGAEEPLERPPVTRREPPRSDIVDGVDPDAAAATAAAEPAAPSVTVTPRTTEAPPAAVDEPEGVDSHRVRTTSIRPSELVGSAPPGVPIVGSGAASGMSLVPGRSFGIIADDASGTPPRINMVRTVSANGTASPPADAAPAAEPVADTPPALPPRRPAHVRTAAADPVRSATPAAPMSLQAATPIAASGAFTVQLSSTRSDAEARSAFSSFQRRYPEILSGYKPIVQPVALGDRGTFYRLRVGPFASRDDATALCVKLKGAGGNCLVQTN